MLQYIINIQRNYVNRPFPPMLHVNFGVSAPFWLVRQRVDELKAAKYEVN
jgi:hypothetical protein